jgi:UDP-N-acetylmuramate dehydrogenase
MMALQVPPRFEPRILRNELLAKHTSWRVGGPADVFFKPRDVEDLAAFLSELDTSTPVMFIGLGSNLLVRDGGVRGAVIAMHGAFGDLIKRNDTDVWVGSGVTCAKLAKQCIQWGLGCAEFFSGIPGTVGGAIAMNAGAFGGETWRHIIEVQTIDRAGVLHTRAASEYQVGYRSVQHPLSQASHEWFVGALLRFERNPEVSRSDVSVLLARRKQTQPIGELSCGSVFTNPAGDHAARLIEASGLKSYRIGGARVSEKHANFIINDGSASAEDIERLIVFVQAAIKTEHSVELHPEVRIVGERK